MGGQTKLTETITPYNNANIFYEPIPFELLRTYEHKPQLNITVDGYPAVCKNLDCDFAYINPRGEIAGFTYDSSSRKLEITGTSLPTTLSEIRNISFASSLCDINKSTISETRVECTL